ncbi:formate/nitrite transporter family protein [Pedomonas mirosovicensis]|uniref:formate/nitrite transporter family protein n=1 Tax=Pedomonas mirosovicensis TaxID=2908641 RepID=UPI0021670E90|nr:formate/nitrite transporter family protein [Pedomonas mirosovicensis]MCH8686676.1 formate/nitrite transporter family protein [Pedomonas mirosovicensis]
MERDDESDTFEATEALSPREEHEATKRTSPNAIIIHEAIRREGEEELARPVSSLAWSGLAAGLSMGLSLMGEGLLHAALPDAPWRKLIASFGYSLGFVAVVLGRQQLFTENTLTGVVPVLHAKTLGAIGALARLWSVVFLANITGTILFALVVSYAHLFDADVYQAFEEIGVRAVESGFWTTFVRAIVAGWMIALMVWLLPAAGTARLFVVILLTYFVGLGHLAHVIAGSAEVAYVALVGAIGWDSYFLEFLLPTLLGNTLGGGILVATLNHAQVRAEL